MFPKVIFFDLDETLMASHRAEKELLMRICGLAQEKYGVNPIHLTEQVLSQARPLWQQLNSFSNFKKVGIAFHEGLWGSPGSEFDLDDYRLESWNQALRYLGVEDRKIGREMAEKFLKEKPFFHLLFDDSIPCLEKLKTRKDVRLGMITNGSVEIQSSKIENSGVKPFFEKIFISGEIGIGKPAPDIFYKALDEFGIRADEAIMIGNSLNDDIQGANAAGVKSVWLNRLGEKRTEESPKPDFEITGLEELDRIL